MGEFAVSNRVVARNGIGRFISQCETAAEETVREAIKEGAAMSRTLAPIGSKPDLRTIPLRDSIDTQMLGRTAGVWRATARHALAQELGARPHELPGDVRFFWEEQGRMWEPGENTIQHPGNAPQPFLRPAYEAIMARFMSIARRYYPGG